jgi:S1-C subfamily serine protease
MEFAVEQGVFIGRVNAQSPAGRGGLRTGDIVTTLDGVPMASPRDLSRATSRIKKGEVAQVSLVRDGAPMDLFITF